MLYCPLKERQSQFDTSHLSLVNKLYQNITDIILIIFISTLCRVYRYHFSRYITVCMIEMKIDNSNNSIPEIHAAADELAMGICLCQQQKATSFTLNQNRSPTRPARVPGTRQRPGLSLVLDAGYRDVGTGNLGGKDCPDTATQLQHTQQEQQCRAHTVICRSQINNQAPVHKTLLLLPLSAVVGVGAGKSQLTSESISAL